MRFCYRLFEAACVICLSHVLVAQVIPPGILNPPPKRELRAVWLATVDRLDWPKSNDAGTQQSELRNIFDKLRQKNFNAVVFQVRARGNTFYNSSHEPWASELTGKLGQQPTYDPLQYAIDLSRQYGMELHAWFNFAIVWSGGTAPTSEGKPHIATEHPEWIKTYTEKSTGKQSLWLDPGIPAVRDWLRMVALDLVRNYDIDAVHFDFIRVANTDFPDDDTFQQYGIPSGFTNKDVWRRENMNIFMRSFYDSVQIIKPKVKVGSAPIGIYHPSIAGARSNFNGLALGQDSRRWLSEGKHDYVMPQIYWNIGEQSSPVYDPDFYALLTDWQNESYGRHVYPGLAAYRLDSSSGNYSVADMIAMIDSTRSVTTRGNVFFRYGSLTLKNFLDSVFTLRYSYPALLPLMPWKDSIPPNSPKNIAVRRSPNSAFLTWESPAPAVDGDLARLYVVYRTTSLPINFADIRNVKVVTRENQYIEQPLPPPGTTYYYAVTALDPYQNESASTTIATVTSIPLAPTTVPATFALYQNFPNPFNPATIISFTLPREANVSLRIYDLLGREVAVLVDGVLSAGDHWVQFIANSLPTGVYFYRLTAGEFIETKKMQLIR